MAFSSHLHLLSLTLTFFSGGASPEPRKGVPDRHLMHNATELGTVKHRAEQSWAIEVCVAVAVAVPMVVPVAVTVAVWVCVYVCV
jgi:hypothetical protein